MSDTTPRDQLAQICSLIMDGHYDDPDDDAYALAEEIISRGWRPPARVVTTVEELDALPWRTVIREIGTGPRGFIRGFISEKDDDLWMATGSDLLCPSSDIWLPAVILYEPEEGE